MILASGRSNFGAAAASTLMGDTALSSCCLTGANWLLRSNPSKALPAHWAKSGKNMLDRAEWLGRAVRHLPE